MKIVYQIEGEIQSCASGDPYRGIVGDNSYRGVQVRLTLVSRSPWTGEEEAIYIEGNGKYVRDLGQQIVDHCDSLDELYKSQHNKENK